jgi:hypothetical protein
MANCSIADIRAGGDFEWNAQSFGNTGERTFYFDFSIAESFLMGQSLLEVRAQMLWFGNPFAPYRQSFS